MNKQQQDEQLSAWLRSHTGLMLKVTRSFATSSHDRDDLYQEIVLQVWRSIPRYTGRVAESTWIYRVAFYTAINWTRRQSRHDKAAHTLPHEPVAAQPDTDTRVDWLYDQIATLAPVDRSLALLMLDGLSYRAISETLGLSESNVGVRLTRIRKQLIARLKGKDNHEL